MDTEQNTTELDQVARPPIKLGIIGLGRFTQFKTIPQLLSLTDFFRVTAVCDVEKERRDLVEKHFPNAHYYRRVEDMVDDQDVDLFQIALPSLMHAKCALECLNRNRWTLVENPLALNYSDAQVLRAASAKNGNRLIVAHRELFTPEFRLAQMACEDPRLGEIYEVRVCRQTYLRRNDWQSVKKCGGGCAFRDGPDALMAAMSLIVMPPSQIWSELKRVAGLGDAEDYAHITLRTRGDISADVEINGGQLPPYSPAYVVRGSRGSFSVAQGATEGVLNVIDPNHAFPRRRSSVRTPPLNDMSEPLPQVSIPLRLPETAQIGEGVFWNAIYAHMRRGVPLPYSIESSVEAIRYLQLVKQASPFAK